MAGFGTAFHKGGVLSDDSNTADRREAVVVTGGGTGIGAVIAEAVGRSGAYVVTVDPGAPPPADQSGRDPPANPL